MNKLLVLVIFVFFATSFVQAQHKRAFLVGISHYDNVSTNYEWNDIHGVEDVKLISPLLKQQGFSITEVLDEEATYKHIKSSLAKFVKSCKKNDIVYMHFSTHGQPFEDKDGDEIDEWDEAIVPIDAFKNYKRGKYEGECHLIDDELNLYLTNLRKKIGEKGCIYMTIDACHAGTSSRGDETIRGTMIGFTSNPKKQYNPPMNRKCNYVIRHFNGYCPITYFEACRSDQVNRELKTKNGIYGALSYNIAQVIKTLNISSNSTSFIDAVKQSIKTKGNWPNNQNLVVETTK